MRSKNQYEREDEGMNDMWSDRRILKRLFGAGWSGCCFSECSCFFEVVEGKCAYEKNCWGGNKEVGKLARGPIAQKPAVPVFRLHIRINGRKDSVAPLRGGDRAVEAEDGVCIYVVDNEGGDDDCHEED